MPRFRRRYAPVFSETDESDVLDDLVKDTMTYALQRGDFQSQDETTFPWLYRPGEAKRKQAIRRRQRARGREVELNESVDAHASVLPPGDDVPEGLQEKAVVLAEAFARDPRKRRTLGQIARHVIMGESWDSIASTEGTTLDATKQDASRFQREMRVLVRATPAAIAPCLCIGYFVHSRGPHRPVGPDLVNVSGQQEDVRCTL